MKHQSLLVSLASLTVASAFLSGCKSDYDLDEKLPPNFGSNLMTHLEGNGYKNYSQLVKDLGYDEALSGVALKTLFAADDQAFAEFFANNSWGVTKYEDLSMAQKKMLLYCTMLDNSLQVMQLTSTTGSNGAVEGTCMRRLTAASIYDTVPIITPDQMPDNSRHWAYWRENGKSIAVMKDATTAPILIMGEKFLVNNKITNEDIDFMFRGTDMPNRQSGDASINGVVVSEENQRVANGFVHGMQRVVTPLDNMAEILRHQSETKTFSRLVERFSAPYYAGLEMTRNYNYEHGTDIDSLFIMGYFSKRSGQGETNVYPDMETSIPDNCKLKFDPGWNSYIADKPGIANKTVAMQSDMAVMLVPSDAALEKYWNEGTGRVIKDYYGEWDNVPDHVVAKLINNNMLNSWVASVPSKFGDIVNSTQDPMGIKPEDVDRVWLGCNGAIYLTNKVFSPTEYVSVSFPALVNQNMNILYWAIEQFQYAPYLNSLDAYYSFIIPTNQSLLSYIDPVSYGQTKTNLWKFYYKDKVEDESQRVWASVWEYDLETQTIGDSLREETWIGNLKNRLVDILDNHIVVGDFESGMDYYKTKNGGFVKVIRSGSDIVGFQSSSQIWGDRVVPVVEIYDQSKEGNGKTYIIDMEPLQTTSLSVADILASREDCSAFYELLSGSDILEEGRGKGDNKTVTGSQNGNIATFNNFNYTFYVPTNESIEALLANHTIPTWEEVEEMENILNNNEEMAESLGITAEKVQAERDKINNFLKYHIQDNALFIGMDYASEGAASGTLNRRYETAVIDSKTGKFYGLNVKVTGNAIELTDNKNNVRKVLTDNSADFNIPVREYQLTSGSISTSSFAVIHRIDGPLFYK